MTVKLKQPSAKTFTLGKDIVFPTEQVRRIIDAAHDGKSLLELDIYDGSEDGQKVFHTLTVIGQPVPGDRAPATPDVGSGTDTLKGMTRWPVTVSYYDKSARENAGEQTPEYAMSFELYENGVSRALKLDFNDFVIGGAMSKFDIKTAKRPQVAEGFQDLSATRTLIRPVCLQLVRSLERDTLHHRVLTEFLPQAVHRVFRFCRAMIEQVGVVRS